MQNFDNVIVGTRYFDDAGVIRLTEDLALVSTVDFFTPVVDDPFDFGAIAAANSLSDIYAMGAKAISALNIVGFPEKELPLAVLNSIIEGGLAVSKTAGVPIIGGHTVKAPEPFFGLSVNGIIHPESILSNDRAQSGDRLFLTKPLGSGLITTGLKNGKSEKKWVDNAVIIMKELNKEASSAVLAVAVCGVTDITGYGLLGHLSEMLIASNKSAIIRFKDIPLMEGATELAKAGHSPGGSKTNLLAIEPDMQWQDNFANFEKLILSDAQTSGGLLISISANLANQLINEFKKRNVRYAEIGEIIDRQKWLISVKR